jgi:hypothetical protein
MTTTWVLEDPTVYCCNPPKGHRKWHALQQHWTLPPRIRSKAVNYNLLGVILTPENSNTDSSENELPCLPPVSPSPKRKCHKDAPRANSKPSSITITNLRTMLAKKMIQPPSKEIKTENQPSTSSGEDIVVIDCFSEDEDDSNFAAESRTVPLPGNKSSGSQADEEYLSRNVPENVEVLCNPEQSNEVEESLRVLESPNLVNASRDIHLILGDPNQPDVAENNHLVLDHGAKRNTGVVFSKTLEKSDSHAENGQVLEEPDSVKTDWLGDFLEVSHDLAGMLDLQFE